MTSDREPAVWFPAIRAGTGTDVFTERLVQGLQSRGIRAGITWLPLRAEYAPWSVAVPQPPGWATLAHVNSWLHPRFVPRGMPVVATLHHSIHDPALRPYKGVARNLYHRRWIAPIERRVMRRADAVVAVSRFVAESARAHLVDVPVRVIYNGVDTDRFQPRPNCESRKIFRLLFVGTWTERKGVGLLTPIMRKLGAEYELYYAGGRARTALQDSPPNMHYVGHLDELAVVHAMQNADALLFPSRSEGHPLVAVEAMACGLPVIGSAIPVMREVVVDGETGLLSAGVDATVEAIRRLQAEPELRAQLALSARHRAVQYFSEAAMVDRYIDVYRHIS
jgi:glycosyltransferase involved in cell wall biosynthesis